MTQLVDKERDKYAQLWNVDAYAEFSPGETWLPVFLDMANPNPVKATYSWGAKTPTTVLDAGCGSGKGALALTEAGFDVVMCDLTDEGLSDAARTLPYHDAVLWSDLTPLGQFDYVYCCDVLEHISPEFTMLVITRLLAIARKGVFLSIAVIPDNFGVLVGEPLHRTVMPFQWWRDNLHELADVVESRDLLNAVAFFIKRKL